MVIRKRQNKNEIKVVEEQYVEIQIEKQGETKAYCSICGTPMMEGGKFCGICGTMLYALEEEEL